MKNQMHFYLRNQSSQPRGIVSFKRDGNETFMAISVCAEKDQFFKRIARSIIEGRFKKSIFMKYENGMSLKDVFQFLHQNSSPKDQKKAMENSDMLIQTNQEMFQKQIEWFTSNGQKAA